MNIIRVFPTKTSMTPNDAYAFVGDPQLWRPEADEVHISCTFTWNIEEAHRLHEAWAPHYPVVKLGGPAISGNPGEFIPGMYVKHGVTFTSRGCPKHCPWCLVPAYEGNLQILDVKPGWIVQDNNLLATPREHQAQVYAMLRAQRKRVSFPGGLDAGLIDDWVIGQLKAIPIKEVFLAADTRPTIPILYRLRPKLNFLTRRQLRCYVLIAYNHQTILEATEQLEAVWQAGFLPFAQLFQPPDRYIHYPPEWRSLARTWSRPAIMFAIHSPPA